MTDSRQFAPAESATTAACTQYLMHSALDATQFLWRFHQLIGALSRRQLSLQQVDATLQDAADWTAVTHDVSRAIAEFASTLAQRAIAPHEHAAGSEAASSSDTVVLLARHREQTDALAALLASLAAPEVTNGARRRALTRLNNTGINDGLASAATAWFALLEEVTTASLRALNPAMLAALRTVQPIGFDREVVELEGALATHVSSRIEIENTLARPASLRCSCREVRRADGVGPAFAPTVTMTPAEQVLEANAQGEVEVSLWLDGAQFDGPAQYVGALCVESDGGSTLDIPLRITTAPARP